MALSNDSIGTSLSFTEQTLIKVFGSAPKILLLASCSFIIYYVCVNIIMIDWSLHVVVSEYKRCNALWMAKNFSIHSWVVFCLHFVTLMISTQVVFMQNHQLLCNLQGATTLNDEQEVQAETWKLFQNNKVEITFIYKAEINTQSPHLNLSVFKNIINQTDFCFTS